MIAHPDRFVDDFLLPGERMIFRSPPEMLPWITGQLPDYLAIAVTLWVVVVAEGVLAVGALVALAVLVGQLVWRALEVWYTRYVLTSYRALRVSGILRTDCEWMAWSKVTDVSVRRSVPDRLFHTATIEIRNANEDSPFRAMADVPRPLEFAATISQLVAARQGEVHLDR